MEARGAWIARYKERMSKTREWISIAEIADWLASQCIPARRRDMGRAETIASLRASMTAGEFRVNGRNCVVLRDPSTSITTFDRTPVHRTIDDEFSSLNAKVGDLFESCWLPNETWRRWFARKDLRWPEHFNMETANQPPISETSGKAALTLPSQSSATSDENVDATIASAHGITEDDARGASTNVVARKPKQPPRNSTRRVRDRATSALDTAYPDGVSKGESNKELVAKVAKEIARREEPKVGDTTILRAAGRRKDSRREDGS